MKNIQIILNAILSKDIFDYILIDRDFRVTGVSEGVARYTDTPPQQGGDVFVHLPELVGREAELLEIFDLKEGQLRLETIRKNDHYIDLSIEHYDAQTLLILLHNVTAVTQARQGVLQKSNEATLLHTMLQKIIDAQSALLVVVDREGRMEFANRQFYRQFGEETPELFRYVDEELNSYRELCDYLDHREVYVSIGEETFLLQGTRIEATHILFTLTKVTRIVRENTDLLEEVQYDTLTGVYRKKTFDARITEWVENGESFVLAVADIDNFKTINDTYGHASGDQVLIEFSKLLKQTLPQEGLVARWGGEEFIVALRMSDHEAARMHADLLCQLIASHSFSIIGHLTVSMGFTWRSFCECETLETLLKRADEALYTAKKAGKNRVITAPPPSCDEMCSSAGGLQRT